MRGLIRHDLFLPFLSAGVLLHEERLAGEWIEFGIVHQAGVCRRGGGENLDLLGVDSQFSAGKEAQVLHIGLSAAGVGGDQVVGQELAFAGHTVQIIDPGFELQRRSCARLAHQF